MKYDDFSERLRELKEEFAVVHGREPETIREFEEFLGKKKIGKTKAVRLRSLKGFDL